MENASKALLIAGEILIAILILTLAIVLISNYKQTNEEYGTRIETQEVEAFNSQFLKYIEYDTTGKYVTAQTVITFVNLADDIKENNNIEIKNNTGVDINKDYIKNYILPYTGKMYDKKNITLEDGSPKDLVFLVYYKIDIEYDAGGRINKIKIDLDTKYYKYNGFKNF